MKFFGKTLRFLCQKLSRSSPKLSFSGVIKNQCLGFFWVFLHEARYKGFQIDLDELFCKIFILKFSGQEGSKMGPK